MPKRSTLKLTKRIVERLKAEDKDAIFWDRDLAGFGVRVHATARGWRTCGCTTSATLMQSSRNLLHSRRILEWRLHYNILYSMIFRPNTAMRLKV